jgi:hypothetical protein
MAPHDDDKRVCFKVTVEIDSEADLDELARVLMDVVAEDDRFAQVMVVLGSVYEVEHG